MICNLQYWGFELYSLIWIPLMCRRTGGLLACYCGSLQLDAKRLFQCGDFVVEVFLCLVEVFLAA